MIANSRKFGNSKTNIQIWRYKITKAFSFVSIFFSFLFVIIENASYRESHVTDLLFKNEAHSSKLNDSTVACVSFEDG